MSGVSQAGFGHSLKRCAEGSKQVLPLFSFCCGIPWISLVHALNIAWKAGGSFRAPVGLLQQPQTVS